MEELQGTLRNSEKVRGTSWISKELLGAIRNSKEIQGAPRNSKEIKRTLRNLMDHKGSQGILLKLKKANVSCHFILPVYLDNLVLTNLFSSMAFIFMA